MPPACPNTVARPPLGPQDKDRTAEPMKEKLLQRLANPDAPPREWRSLAYCLSQLGHSDKGVRRAMELTKQYAHTLAEDEVRSGWEAQLAHPPTPHPKLWGCWGCRARN